MLLLLGAVFITVRTLLSGRWRVPVRFPLPPPPPFSPDLDTLLGEAESCGLSSLLGDEELLLRCFTSCDDEGERTRGTGGGGNGLRITVEEVLVAAILLS